MVNRTSLRSRRLCKVTIAVMLVLPALFLSFQHLTAQNIQRFEYINSRDGLSQNTVYSILFDRNGFMWLGTTNGLNRYDGQTFRVFKNLTPTGESRSNNRVDHIWQDRLGFIWMQSYDGFYHYFNQRDETFRMLPDQSDSDDMTGRATCFLQYSDSLIFVGTHNSGVIMLAMRPGADNYASATFVPTTAGNQPARVQAMMRDADGNLWITTTQGLALLTSAQVRSGATPEAKIFFATTEFAPAIVQVDSCVLFATRNDGVLVYKSAGQTFDYIAASPADRHVSKIVTTACGKFVVATEAGEILIFDNDLTLRRRLTVHGRHVEQIYVDQYRQAWVTCRELGLTRISLTDYQTRFYSLTPATRAASVDLERHFFKEDCNNNLWIGTHGGGLAWYDRIDDRFEFFRNDIANLRSIPSNIIHCIAEDHSGQLWIGCGQYQGGLVKVIASNKAFATIVPDKDTEYQSDNVVRAVMEDSANNLWVSTKSGKIYVYNEQFRVRRVIDGFACSDGHHYTSVAYSIYADRDGYLWICTKGCGVFVSQRKVNFANIEREPLVFDNYRSRTSASHFGISSALGDDNAYGIVQDAYGNMWVATYGNGLSRIRRNDNGVEIDVFNTHNSNLTSNKVRHLMIDDDNNLWVATTMGVNRVDGTYLNGNKIPFVHLVHHDNSNSLSYNDVCHIYQSSDSKIYFSTIGGGLSELSAEGDSLRFVNCDVSNGLCNDVVYAVTEDNAGDLWIATENGLNCKSKESMAFETFNVNNGLISNSFSEATCLRLHNGRLIFGCNVGFVALSPLQLASSPYKGRLMLTGFQIANKNADISGENSPLTQSITYSDRIDLKHNQSSIAIDYKLLDFIDPQIVQYAYRLDGFDQDWNYVGNQTRAIYTNLAPGDYVFRVRCTYRNGEWSNSDTTISIHISSPWWKTGAAFFFYFVVFIAVVSIVIRTVMRINRYRRDLDIVKRVNEIKLQFFTNISHEIRTPLTLILSPIDDILKAGLPDEVNRQVLIIKRNADRILLLVNQLLDFRKVQNNKMHLNVCEVGIDAVVRPAFDSFSLLAEHKHIDLQLSVPDNLVKVWVDPRLIETVVYNLMSNAIKFTSDGKRVSLSIRQDEAFTDIVVSDQGRGISAADMPELFKRYTILSNNELSGTGIGLSLSYEFVKLHQGDLTVDSEPGRGSTFTVRLRNGRRHFDGNPMVSIGSEVNYQSGVPAPASYAVDALPADGEPDTADTAQRKVLVVEDNPEILDYVCQTLQHQYVCLRATNGSEAVMIAREQLPDVIVSDLMMPVMDGLEMIKILRNDFATSHIPIIALTAKASMDDEIEAVRLGFDAYIHKPFNTDYLKAVVDSISRQREKLIKKYCQLEPSQTTDAEPARQQAERDVKEADVVNAHLQVKMMSKDEEFIRDLVAFTESNYRTDMSIDKFAENFHMSRTVFYNKVKGLTGNSPLEFVRQIKLTIAERLLQKGFNVSEVAFEIGYSDVKYFSKQFRAHFGYAPSQIKKNLKSTDS